MNTTQTPKRTLKPWKRLGLMRPDIRKMLANDKDNPQREEDHTAEVLDWEDESNVRIDDRNDQITVCEMIDAEPDRGCYSIESLQNLPSEAFKSVIIAADISREQMAEVVQITKPAGRILRGI